MSIKNIFGNWKSYVSHSSSQNLNDISKSFTNILSGSTAKLSSLWDGGFVGIDVNNYEDLTRRIDLFVEDMEEISTRFAQYSDISGALKGQAAEAAKEYIKELTLVINAYISFYKNFNVLITETADKMLLNDKENSNAIVEEASNVINDANNIRIDE